MTLQHHMNNFNSNRNIVGHSQSLNVIENTVSGSFVLTCFYVLVSHPETSLPLYLQSLFPPSSLFVFLPLTPDYLLLVHLGWDDTECLCSLVGCPWEKAMTLMIKRQHLGCIRTNDHERKVQYSCLHLCFCCANNPELYCLCCIIFPQETLWDTGHWAVIGSGGMWGDETPGCC